MKLLLNSWRSERSDRADEDRDQSFKNLSLTNSMTAIGPTLVDASTSRKIIFATNSLNVLIFWNGSHSWATFWHPLSLWRESIEVPGRNSELSGRKLELFDRDKLCTFSPRLLSKDCFGFALDGLKLFVVRLQDEKIVKKENFYFISLLFRLLWKKSGQRPPRVQ